MPLARIILTAFTISAAITSVWAALLLLHNRISEATPYQLAGLFHSDPRL